MKKQASDFHEAPTRVEPALKPDPQAAPPRHVLPPTSEGDEATELVTLWLPASYLRDVRAIQAARHESVADVMVRHSKSNVATEARACRFEGV